MNKNLNERITIKLGEENIENISIPEYITNNLKHDFFEWQKSALQYLLAYNNKEKNFLKFPTHLMFNMATGTGKTLLMAATILYYYKKGYKHFLFFVNQNNIIDKTENNFIDSTHYKYLFKEKIVIDDKIVEIEKVNAFSDAPEGIEIKFTSIQKLYNDVHLSKENQTTLDDLQNKDIVMLADEAHHLNANTKSKELQLDIKTELNNRTGKDKVEKKGWEDTVIELILKKQGKVSKNVLLEFTATIPDNKQVVEKYRDKIIYTFDLKEFLNKGYTKEINLISSTLGKKERVLQALLFQWYRHKIALRHGIINFKPVILFRSKTIDESKNDYKEFLDWVDNLGLVDFDFLRVINNNINQPRQLSIHEMGKSRTEQVLQFIRDNDISYTEIIEWVKNSFQDRNTIITNSKTNKTKKEKTTEDIEKLLNSLEDKDNHIRAIFTVDRLTEGWDVLNLFDIVRLYQGQNAGGTSKKTPDATTKEKQLIGRGVRYFPFSYGDKQINERKFDGELNHELRILEELYYYTYDEESRYISHLKAELKKDGYISDDRKLKTFDLKKEFKKTDFYKNTKIWYNKKEDNPNRKKQNLESVKKDVAEYAEYRVSDIELKEDKNILDEKLENENKVIKEKTKSTITKKFKDIEKHIFQKAIHKSANKDPLFRFENLKNELKIKRIEDLRNDNFLGNFKIKIIANKNYENIEHKEKLLMTQEFLETVFNKLKEYINPKIGGEFIAVDFKKIFNKPKTKSIEKDKLDDSITENKWYVLDGFVGTNEEKRLVEFIKNSIGNLEERYDKIYLLRNEEIYKIYDFEKGRGFAPDFLLFLKNENNNLNYQIFIEPKGDHLISKDEWKENFLTQITKEYGLDNIIQKENLNYKLIGLPFFNNNNTRENFGKEFDKLIN